MNSQCTVGSETTFSRNKKISLDAYLVVCGLLSSASLFFQASPEYKLLLVSPVSIDSQLLEATLWMHLQFLKAEREENSWTLIIATYTFLRQGEPGNCLRLFFQLSETKSLLILFTCAVFNSSVLSNSLQLHEL